LREHGDTATCRDPDFAVRSTAYNDSSMPLVITPHTESSIPLEVDTVRLEELRTATASDALSTLIQRGNKQVQLGDFFKVSGSASDNALVWEGDCSKVKLIGSCLSEGSIRVTGDAGMHLGAEMTGGEIVVEGNAADWVGAELHGGRIHIHGNAGHLVGAAYRGGRRGMTGGEILINGNAGNEIGHTLRRGLIAVGGRTGDALGFNMIAGTIVLAGDDHGIRPGAGMRRGTIVYTGSNAPEVLPTFKDAGHHTGEFLSMYFASLRASGFPIDVEPGAAFRRFTGDHLEMGKGEILVRSPQEAPE
jgi:formylmethanofuran dehydrogenase subunit C